ncbi:MAG: type II toxin-antitoxin system VapC family toxin [Solirubrobacterales bacterium]
MTVLDTSVVVDYLLGHDSARRVQELLEATPCAAPDVVVFETLAVLRRAVLRGALPERRAAAAVDDLGDLPLDLYPALTLRGRAWALRDKFSAADALFVALAGALGLPLATADRALARGAARHAGIDTVDL